MKTLWCWRCQTDLPMLDEDEYTQAALLYANGMKNREASGDRQERFKELLDFYFALTGYRETEPNAILHHRIAHYGPPCEKCGKPYRTNEAVFCAACGYRRTAF